jgi:putative endonuclease
MSTRDIGLAAELIAADFLDKSGYKIIEHGWQNRYGEIDIIALDGDTLVFVEVKSKSGDRYGEPGEMIIPKKIEKIKKAAYNFIETRMQGVDHWRIDAVLVKSGECEHLKNITL